ncbi:MAG: hypothetical protein HYX86_01385, partial [Chloroflexi bacterium]|nr:hypothetical protein [Chloroflexota bacterium]
MKVQPAFLMVASLVLLATLVAACGPAAGPTATSTPANNSEEAPPLAVANVARDPSDVPPPITRTEPTTVEVTLTIR